MHLGVTVSPLLDDQGALQGAVCLFTDLTAVVDLEEQLRLKDSLARLGELTAGLAHEFRNGLATIHGYARLIDPAQVPAQYAAYVQGIRDETDALGRVVTNFLNFARPAQLTLVPIEIGALVARAVDEIRPEVDARRATATVAGEFATVDGDEVLLRQAVVQPAAERRRGVRGTLRAAAASGLTARSTMSSSCCASWWRTTDPEWIPPFARRSSSRSSPRRSTAPASVSSLVQKIVVTHNGRMTLASPDAGGAAFQMALPLSRIS